MGVTQVSLQTLRQFLEDPLQGAAGFRLRMREIDTDEERIDRDDEPFESERTARTLRLRAAILSVLARGPGGGPDWSIGAPTWAEVRAAHAALARRDELLGRIPTGFFREAEGPAEEEILATWWEHARTVGGGWPAVGRILRFGRAAELEPADDLRDPIVLSVSVAGAPARRLEIVGRTELVVAPKGDAPGRLAGLLVPLDRGATTRAPTASCCAPFSITSRSRRPACRRARTRRCWPSPAARPARARRAARSIAGSSRRSNRRARASYLETLAAELLEGAPDPGDRSAPPACTPISCRTRRSSPRAAPRTRRTSSS